MKLARGLPLLFLLPALSGCYSVRDSNLPAAQLPADGGKAWTIVGKVVLDPPLAPSEQIFPRDFNAYRNRFILISGDTPVKLPRQPTRRDVNSGSRAEFGELFSFRVEDDPLHINGAYIMMELLDYARLPGGLRVRRPPGAAAVYIGTLRYARDEYFTVREVTVIDEYEQAKNEYAARYGSGVPLARSLAERASRPSM